MRTFILIILAVALAAASELDPAWDAFAAGQYADGAALLRKLTDAYRKQSQVPEARRRLTEILAKAESADGPDAESVEIICLELSQLNSVPTVALQYLQRANRIARIKGRLEPDRELRMADLQLKATLTREALENLEYITPKLEQELGKTNAHTLEAYRLLALALKREGSAEKAAAIEARLTPQKAENAGTVLGETEPGVYAVKWQAQLPKGAGVEVRRQNQAVGRGVVTPKGEVHVVGMARLEPNDTLHYEQAQPSQANNTQQTSASYKRAVANWNSQIAKGKITLAELPAAQERLERIGAKVAEASRRNVPWHFYIVKDKSPNAACLGEGVVFVTTGLLKLGLSDDELAGVLGHEIAHGTEMHIDFEHLDDHFRRQALKELEEAERLAARYEREYQQDESMNAEASYRSKMVTVQRRLSSARKKAEYLAGKKQFSQEFDQQQEIEADQIGMRYAVTAGYSAEGLMGALQKLHGSSVSHFGYGYSAESRTHPPVARRLEVLKKVQASWQR